MNGNESGVGTGEGWDEGRQHTEKETFLSRMTFLHSGKEKATRARGGKRAREGVERSRVAYDRPRDPNCVISLPEKNILSSVGTTQLLSGEKIGPSLSLLPLSPFFFLYEFAFTTDVPSR